MTFEEQLQADFTCVKCRGKVAVTKTLSLGRGLPELLTLSSEKYTLLSCALCGYTEIYSHLAHAPTKEAKQATEGAKSLANET